MNEAKEDCGKIREVDRPYCGWLAFPDIKDVPKFRVELEIQISSLARENILERKNFAEFRHMERLLDQEGRGRR